MTANVPDCPDCRVSMEIGFILDVTHGGYAQATWVRGAVERSFWTGIKLRDRERIPIVTFRCPRCGQLKSFAQPG